MNLAEYIYEELELANDTIDELEDELEASEKYTNTLEAEVVVMRSRLDKIGDIAESILKGADTYKPPTVQHSKG